MIPDYMNRTNASHGTANNQSSDCSGLSPKQARFVDEYLLDLNASAAYRRAGYSARGNAAEVTAHQLLRNPKVAAAIAEAQASRSTRTRITVDAVLTDLLNIAHCDVRHAFDENGNPLPPHLLPAELARCIASIEVKNGTNGRDIRIRFADRMRSYELIARHLGMLKDRIEVTTTAPDVSQLTDEELETAIALAQKLGSPQGVN
jgi:phage terminase small subunit